MKTRRIRRKIGRRRRGGGGKSYANMVSGTKKNIGMPSASALTPSALTPSASALTPSASALTPSASALTPSASALTPSASALIPSALIPSASALSHSPLSHYALSHSALTHSALSHSALTTTPAPTNMGQTFSYTPLASYAFIPKYFGIEETQEGIEETKNTFGNPNNNLCKHMINFFPAFSIEPAKKHNLSEEDTQKFKTIICSLLYMFGTFTKYLHESDRKNRNKIIVKGGTALKLLTSHPMNINPDFKYDSEDIDILVTGKGAEDFASEMAAYIKWIYAVEVPNRKNQWYNNSILQIESQARGLNVFKLYFVVPGKKIAICDIEYKEEIDNPYYADENLVTTMNKYLMFHCQNIQAFYAEKEMLYNKYSEQCRVHRCKESSDSLECKECNFLKKKFKKPMDAINLFYKKNNISKEK